MGATRPGVRFDTAKRFGVNSAMPANHKLDDKMVAEAVKLGDFKTKQEALNAALVEFVQRRNRLRILELAGAIQFHPDWDYKRMRGAR